MAAKHGRTSVYTGLVGMAVGVLVTGLLVPFVDGEREASVVAGSESGFDAGDVTTGADGSVAPGATPLEDGGTIDTGGTGTAGSASSGPAGTTATGSSPSGSSTPSGPSGTSRASGPLRATDRGVTATTVKVGFLLLDLGQAGRIGVNTTGVDPDQQEAAFNAFVDDLNGRGGIHGRKVEPFYKVFDATNPEDQQEACIAATEDAKVFGVVAMPGFANAAVLCVTQQHETPLVVTGQAISREFLRKSEGRLVTLQMAGDRMMRNFAAELSAKGVLKDRKIGIVSSDEVQYIETVEGIFVPALEQAGHEVVHVSRLATWPRSQGQIPPEVQRMRAAGADAVVFVGSFLNATTWVQTAEQQRWLPRYFVSEWGGMTSDFEMQAMPQSFDGALAMTSQRFGEWRSNAPEPASAKRCIDLYEEETGEEVPVNKGNESNAAYPVIIYACDMFKAFVAVANATGPELTRPAWAAAVPRAGAVEQGFYFPGAFGPGKTDLTDQLRFNRADISCRCWRNLDAPRPARFR